MKLESVYFKFLGIKLEVRFKEVREEIYNLTNSDIYIVVNTFRSVSIKVQLIPIVNTRGIRTIPFNT